MPITILKEKTRDNYNYGNGSFTSKIIKPHRSFDR